MKHQVLDVKKINRTLMAFCSTLYQSALGKGYMMPDIYFAIPANSTLLYLYPDSPEILANKAGITIEQLKELGWLEPSLAGKAFIIWYASKYIQLCEVDAIADKYIKPAKGLNKDIPYLYTLCASKKEFAPYVVVTSDPLHATILTAKGVSAVACGSQIPTKSQIGYLARLSNKLIYLTKAGASGDNASELIVKKMAKYTDINVCFIKDWNAALQSEKLIDSILFNSVDGIEFIVKRMLEKHNGKSDYERSLEIIQAAKEVGDKNHNRLLKLAKKSGSYTYAHFAESLHLMADLIQANIPVDTARQIALNRYGVAIYLRDKFQVKLT
ncbi:hypothetical protein [Thalassotalea piscium]|uniref:Uncharacterized protein n=1 Tax=Thalassotalea piscium TaxID=1230533 RepID=A0A7X0NKI1_9GAMM|nr:hypothetical protein [Thalassotalea piscium]MBB6545119.1 hypothetical protein [Thalassotalea piscium]